MDDGWINWFHITNLIPLVRHGKAMPKQEKHRRLKVYSKHMYVNRCLLPGSRPSGLSLLPLVTAPVGRLLDVEAVDLGLDGLEVALAALVDHFKALKEVVQLPGKLNRT